MERIAAEIDRRRDDLARTLAIDQGKPLEAEARDEVEELITYFSMAAADARRMDGLLPPSVDGNKRVLVERIPRGVAGIISPWNWPYTMPAEILAPALAWGLRNTRAGMILRMAGESSDAARALGYDGKWALHPDQVTILNEVFSPSQEQFDKAWEILDAYELATEGEGKGAVMFGDEMIDEASRKMAIKFVSRGERAGLTRSARPSA